MEFVHQSNEVVQSIQTAYQKEGLEPLSREALVNLASTIVLMKHLDEINDNLKLLHNDLTQMKTRLM